MYVLLLKAIPLLCLTLEGQLSIQSLNTPEDQLQIVCLTPEDQLPILCLNTPEDQLPILCLTPEYQLPILCLTPEDQLPILCLVTPKKQLPILCLVTPTSNSMSCDSNFQFYVLPLKTNFQLNSMSCDSNFQFRCLTPEYQLPILCITHEDQLPIACLVTPTSNSLSCDSNFQFCPTFYSVHILLKTSNPIHLKANSVPMARLTPADRFESRIPPSLHQAGRHLAADFKRYLNTATAGLVPERADTDT